MSTPDRITVVQRYRATSRADEAAIRLVSDGERAPVRASGRVRDPVPLREALSALHEIVSSDLRYRPKDRSAYLAWRRLVKRSRGLSGMAAQREYYDWLAANDPLAWFVLDPVITVHPDAVLMEVFSRDEGTYAQLSIRRDALEVDGDWQCGTTSIDFGAELVEGVQRIRRHQPLRLDIGASAVSLETGGQTVVEKRIPVPERWLRGFLQVGSAAALAHATVPLRPVDVYNVLRHLRLHADRKRERRAIRAELVPGRRPRLVIEPWEWSIEGSEPYSGHRPEVVRIWGRRRWMLARRFLPFVDTAALHLVGSGLPSFLVLGAGPLSLTLGLTGFVASDWAGSLQLDALMPRAIEDAPARARVIEALGARSLARPDELAAAASATPAEVAEALQVAGQRGQVMFDLARGVVRLRSLTPEPLDMARLQYRDDRERTAADLVIAGAVTITREEAAFGTGTELVATVAADGREYRTSFVLDDEGHVRKAACTCAPFRSHGLKEGPCPHLLALRLEHAAARNRGGRVPIETRTFARRQDEDAPEVLTQLSLDHRRLKIRWGRRTDERLRLQTLLFDTESDARSAYLERVARLEAAGWLDARER